MNDLDKWAAEQCGATLNIAVIPDVDPYWYNDRDKYYFPWTLSDPRCMQVFLSSILKDDVLEAYVIDMLSGRVRVRINTGNAKYSGFGKTIHEAEMACAQAIYDKLEVNNEENR